MITVILLCLGTVLKPDEVHNKVDIDLLEHHYSSIVIRQSNRRLISMVNSEHQLTTFQWLQPTRKIFGSKLVFTCVSLLLP